MNRCQNARTSTCGVRQTAPERTFHTSRMRFINDQRRAESLTQSAQFSQRRAIPFHAEDTFHHYNTFAAAVRAPERVFEIVEIKMRNDHFPDTRKANAVDQTGM